MRTRTRLVFSFAIIALAALVLLLETTPKGFAQKGKKSGGGADGGGPPGGGTGVKKFDPGKFFDRMSKGQDCISIDSMWIGKEQAAEWAKKEGITNGKLTREQYLKFSEQMMQMFQKGGRPGGTSGDAKAAPDGKGGGKGGPDGKGGKGGKGPPDPEDIFKRYD